LDQAVWQTLLKAKAELKDFTSHSLNRTSYWQPSQHLTTCHGRRYLAIAAATKVQT
jgi:hypothetical protein